MQKRVSLLPIAVIFLLLSILLITSSSVITPFLTGLGLDNAVRFLQGATVTFAAPFEGSTKQTEEALQKQNDKAVVLIERQEMQALRDQFQTTTIPSTQLLPAKIIGFMGFIPKVSRPVEIVIDKGSADTVRVGMAVVYKNNLVGKVSKVQDHRSLITLLTKSGWSFTAKTSKTAANGLAVIEGGDIFFNNIILSDTLQKGDLVVTKGDQTLDGTGFPPDIVVGEVVSVEKEASALFQNGKVKSLVDVTKLSLVFVSLVE